MDLAQMVQGQNCIDTGYPGHRRFDPLSLSNPGELRRFLEYHEHHRQTCNKNQLLTGFCLLVHPMVYDHHYLYWYHHNLDHRRQAYCCPYLCIYFGCGDLLVHQEEAAKLDVQGQLEVLRDGEYYD